MCPSGVTRVIDAIGRERLPHYTFISQRLVYAEHPPNGGDEHAPLATLTADQLKEAEAMATGARATAGTYGELYGALKAACERAAEERMPGRVLHVRPGLIVGPYDYSDRFTYWVRRWPTAAISLAPGAARAASQGDRRPRFGGVDRAHDRRQEARRLQCDRRRGWC